MHFTEQWSEFYRNASKPFIDLAEFYVKSISLMYKSSEIFNEFSHFKGPEDFMSAHMKLMNQMGQEYVKYTQQAYGMFLESATKSGKVFSDTLR